MVASIYSTKPIGVIQKLIIVTLAQVSGEKGGFVKLLIKNSLKVWL